MREFFLFFVGEIKRGGVKIVFCVFDVCEWRAEGFVTQTVSRLRLK
jgi:hypothetical protein